MATGSKVGVVRVETGTPPIPVLAKVNHGGGMETTIVVQALTEAILNPLVLGATAVGSLAFLTGGAARLAELWGKATPRLFSTRMPRIRRIAPTESFRARSLDRARPQPGAPVQNRALA